MNRFTLAALALCLLTRPVLAQEPDGLTLPKGAKVIEGKGLRVYPGMIDSGTELGLSEVSSTRETVDTGELGEFMPQLRALSAVNPESEHFGVVRVNGITSAMTFPSSGGGGGRFGGGDRQFISGQAALIHTGRRAFLSLEGSYHGNSLAGLSIGASDSR